MKKWISNDTGSLIQSRKNPDGSFVMEGTSKDLISDNDKPRCKDCGEILRPQWYGFNCTCGQMYNNTLEYATESDLF